MCGEIAFTDENGFAISKFMKLAMYVKRRKRLIVLGRTTVGKPLSMRASLESGSQRLRRRPWGKICAPVPE
jgi:hypothetical protein